MKRVLAVVALLALCASASWGAIGVYKWAPRSVSITEVPAGISYMLNANADDTTGGWSVKIEIVPLAGGSAVRTWTFAYPDANCAKGMHTNAVIWNGKDDGGLSCPSGNYKAVITAKRAAVSGTDVVAIFEQGGGSYYAIAVNKNPDSAYYGRIYATYKNEGVKIYEPDGTLVGTFTGGVSWSASSAPWGIAIDASDNVWVTNRSTRQIHCFTPDMATKLHGPIGMDYDRNLDVYGPTSDVKVLDTHCLTSSGAAGAYARLMFASGNAASMSSLTQWTTPTGTADSFMFQQPKLFSDSGTVKALVPARLGVSGGAWTDGGLLKYSIPWGGTTPTEEWRNTNLTLGMAVDLAPDGSTLWMSRNTGTAGEQFWTMPLADAATATGATVTKHGISGTAAGTKRIQFFRMDAIGNLACTFGGTNSESWQAYYGVFEQPGSDSSDSRTTSTIHWGGDPQPTFDSSTGPYYGSACDPNATVTITVYASDIDGYLDIWRDSGHLNAGCFLDRSPFGQGVVPMNPVSGNGNTAVYQLGITIPSGVVVGEHHLPVYVRDRDYPAVPQAAGEIVINVAGGWISGVITNSITGWPVADATVEAVGANTFTAKTDANGAYIVGVDPGSYAVNAHKPGANSSLPRYADSTVPATDVTVSCNQTIADINRTLNPLIVWTATGANARNDPDQRPLNEVVCVRGIVFRAAQNVAGGVANGLNGYYYIYDTAHNSTPAGCKVQVFTGQTALKEGDEVIVEGTWMKPLTGSLQGEIVPVRAPYVVATGKAGPTPYQMSYYTDTNLAYGRLLKYSGPVTNSNPAAGNFTLRITWAPSHPDPSEDRYMQVWADTTATTGITIPANGTLVEVLGINCIMGVWGDNVLVCGKPSDIYSIQTVTSLGAAKSLPDGGVIIDASANPLVVTYIDKGDAALEPGYWFYLESPDRTAGLKVNVMKAGGGSGFMPAGLEPGYKVTHLRGNLALPTSSTPSGQLDIPREIQLSETPTILAGDPSNIPAFLGMNIRAFGGGKHPKPLLGVGTGTEGLLLRVTGVASGYASDGNWEWFYLDDGSGMPNEGGHTGVKVFRSLKLRSEFDRFPFPTMDGDFVTVQGISTTRYVTGGRIRMLYVRWDPTQFDVQDEVQILTP